MVKPVRGDHLLSGATKSCGCLHGNGGSQPIPMEGLKFGRLIVIARAGSVRREQAKWLCECECGNTRVVPGRHLRNGSISSCGCEHRERMVEGLVSSSSRAIASWRALPVPSALAGQAGESVAGIAAEYLVCADLLLQGHLAFPTANGYCPYDVVVDLGNLVRIQVKATREPRVQPRRGGTVPVYKFFVRRPSGRPAYVDGEFDLLALVALDIRQIAYLPPVFHKQTVFIRQPGSGSGKQFSDFPFAKAVAELGLGLL